MIVEPTLISSISDFVGVVNTSRACWFRGHERLTYELRPSLFRHPTISAPLKVSELEGKLLARFRQRSIPYLKTTVGSDLDYLFIMQHFGVPTRLLDWTENPFIALYFALESWQRVDSDASFYSVDPLRWNEVILEGAFSDIKIFDTSDELIRNGYQIGPTTLPRQPNPIAIFGNYNSPRIVAQKGTFFIFGANTQSMEQLVGSEAKLVPCAKKYQIPKSSKKALFEELQNIGITDTTLFPDLEGLGREIKRSMGFEV